MTILNKLFWLASQALNVLAFGGDPDESLSARAWRQRANGYAKVLARIDKVFGAGHCEWAYGVEQTRRTKRA